MQVLNGFTKFTAQDAARAADEFDTPLYVYDEEMIINRCRECLDMPNPYGLTVRYAMKANSNRAILKLISGAGLHIDASSLGEVVRANLAAIPLEEIRLTTQEVPQGENRKKLEQLMLSGLNYNVCSMRQLHLIADFAAANKLEIGIRVHPGVGAGESSTRNTGDEYACFGVHRSELSEAVRYAGEKGLKFKHIHEHIGSGGDPEKWRENIDIQLSIVEEHFPDATLVCFGGGLKEARMPFETKADVNMLGLYAKERIEQYYEKTGVKLQMEIEPGTYIVANAGYAITRIMDKKKTARADFIIIDGSMEINSRPLLYGSVHPIYIVSADGRLLSSEFSDLTSSAAADGAAGDNTAITPDAVSGADAAGVNAVAADADVDAAALMTAATDAASGIYKAVVAGKCCESGDCQTLDSDGHAIQRRMAEPEIEDIAIIGGTGAYCSSMAPFNYNSHVQAPEVLFTTDGRLELIRKRQTLEQMLENEI